MITRHALVLSLLAIALPSQAQNYSPHNKQWIILSPQVGGSWGPSSGPVAGASISFYPEEEGGAGVGAGLYGHGGAVEIDILGKLSYRGVFGGGLGLVVLDGKPGPAVDLWGNAIILGLRWKATSTRHGVAQSLSAFLPLWYLNYL